MISGNLREQAKDIFSHAIKVVDPYLCVTAHASRSGDILRVGGREYSLRRYDRVIVIGAGKASALMGKAVEELLGDRITSGLIVVKYGHAEPLTHIQVAEAGHPLPDQAGVEATEKIMRLLRGLDDRTLVLCLISGGGSALLVRPAEGITLEEKIRTTRLLLNSGASIHELNIVRKHLSRTKGGKLGLAAAPATVISLILSDVIGDPLDVIASGPTVFDSSSFQDALAVLKKYGLPAEVPDSVRILIEGHAANQAEHARADNRLFLSSIQNHIVGNIRQALAAAEKRAEALGYRTLLLTSRLHGEAREVAKIFGAIAREIRESSKPINAPACILSGGETTVTVQGDGRGGRNQEMALSAAFTLSNLEHVLFLSAGTDGTDGPTDAAGAFADGTTLARAARSGIDPHSALARNDSYHLFKEIGDLYITGPTRTNVMDIQILLAG